MSVGATLSRGFADPVTEAQSAFRSIMTALSRPGTIADLIGEGLNPPAPLTPELAAIALTLCDHETQVWLDRRLTSGSAVASFIKFQTGAPVVDDPASADFAFAVDMDGLPPLAAFAQGSDEYPDRSTTLALAVEKLGSGRALSLAGPGIKERAALAPLTEDFIAELVANHARFPRGVDCVFTSSGKLAALPRSTRVARGATDRHAGDVGGI
jgi:alpha-D-ribose 1-methylphosphonate 5-triphosphate synthase subunit PhnH